MSEENEDFTDNANEKLPELKGLASVGRVRDSHGLKGELFVVTNLDELPAWSQKVKKFLLKFQNPTEQGKHRARTSEFTVKKIRAHKKGFIVTTEEIADRNHSDMYKGALFYIDESFLESKKGERIYLKEIKGFEVIDGEVSLGKITSFSSNNAQDLLVVTGEKTIEIPFVENFIKQIDWENKRIIMELPEGLY